MLTVASPTWTYWSLVTVRVSPSSAGLESVSARGRLTPIPDCIMGAVTMKMTSRTSMTSTNGVTLISESEVPTCLRPRDDDGRDWVLRAMEPLGDAQEFEGEVLHVGDEVLDPAEEVVVGDDGRHGREEPDGRGDEGLGDARGDDLEAGRAHGADADEGDHDAPDGPEEADE